MMFNLYISGIAIKAMSVIGVCMAIYSVIKVLLNNLYAVYFANNAMSRRNCCDNYTHFLKHLLLL